jgi:hypothetical protein
MMHKYGSNNSITLCFLKVTIGTQMNRNPDSAGRAAEFRLERFGVLLKLLLLINNYSECQMKK